jgi:hypothetical protein
MPLRCTISVRPIDMLADFSVFDHCSASAFERATQLTSFRLVTGC